MHQSTLINALRPSLSGSRDATLHVNGISVYENLVFSTSLRDRIGEYYEETHPAM